MEGCRLRAERVIMQQAGCTGDYTRLGSHGAVTPRMENKMEHNMKHEWDDVEFEGFCCSW